MSTSTITTLLKTLTISTSLLSSGSILTLSLFTLPILQSQPSSHSLPSTRWLFSRGSHIFPQASILTFSGFLTLAYLSLPIGSSLTHLFKFSVNDNGGGLGVNGWAVNGYLAAAVATISLFPITMFGMIGTNFRLIELNNGLGGKRSVNAANAAAAAAAKSDKSDKSSSKQAKTAEESALLGIGEGNEYTDLSLPMEKTPQESSEEQDEEVRRLLGKFKVLNYWRAVMMGLGGVVGLVASMA